MTRSSSWHVAEYRFRNMWKWKIDILVYGLGNPVLYLASLGIGLGTLIDRHNGGNGMEGVPYLTFLAPALLASAAIQGAQDEAVFPVLAGFIWQKLFFAMHATSLRVRQIVHGVLIAAIVRSVFTAAVYWSVLLAFGAVQPMSALWLIPSAAFAGLAFACVILPVAASVEHDDGFFAIFGRFVITPMFLFSGTFYPLHSLPMSVQWIGWVSPLWHATELGRALSYGAGSSAPGFFVHVLYLATIAVVGLLAAYRQFERRLTA